MRYADDTTLLARDEAEIKMLKSRRAQKYKKQEGAKLALKINLSKSKLMVVDRGVVLPRPNILNKEKVD